MRHIHLTIGTVALFGLLGVAGCSSDKTTAAQAPLRGTVIHVSINDQTAVNKPMTLTIDRSDAPAGDVTFVVKNDGNIDHELVVLKTDTPFDKIPVNAAGDPPAVVAANANKILEDNNVGETGEPDVKKGETRTFTINDMAAGSYVLVCNLAEHYQMGLRAPFTVK